MCRLTNSLLTPPMSPPPTSTETHAEVASNAPFLRDIILTTSLGMLAMMARLALAQERNTWFRNVCLTFASGTTAGMVGLATKDIFSSQYFWLATVGFAGWVAPEGWKYAMRWFKAKAGKEVDKAVKERRNAKKAAPRSRRSKG